MISILLCATLLSSQPTQTSPAAPGPQTATEWFQRASDQMNLRMPAAAPFRMKVVFHALPGEEFLPKKQPSQVISGDGTYEETWLSPHQWRREVIFGEYHAIEAQAGGERKMQASSDYEPSRVLMLLEALLNPISRYDLSPELQSHRLRWKTENLTVSGQFFVRISTSTGLSTRITLGTAYIFSQGGGLLQSNENDTVTNWQDYTGFHGKLVARHLQVTAAGVRDLLTADITISDAEGVDPATLALGGDRSDPGMTLRPLHEYDGKPVELVYMPPGWTSVGGGPDSSVPDFVFRAVIDRHGNSKEVEVISLQPKDKNDPTHNLWRLLDTVRETRYRPAEVDNSPCEVLWSSASASH